MARLARLLPILIPIVRRVVSDPRVQSQAEKARDRYRSFRRR